jgi:hypothetical protein
MKRGVRLGLELLFELFFDTVKTKKKKHNKKFLICR